MDSLKELLPGRTSHEIASLIQTYKQRAKRLSYKDTMSRPSSSSSSSTIDPSHLRDSPLSQWSNYVGHVISARNKREDVSTSLVSAVEKYSVGEEAKSTQDNHSSIYKFLADCLQGKCPRELNAQDSLIVLKLLKQAKFVLNYVGCDSERKFIQNVSKERAVTSRKANDHNEDETVTGEKEVHEEGGDTRKEDDGEVNNLFEKDMSCSTSNFVDLSTVTPIECHEANDLLTRNTIQRRLNQFVEICMDLPKVKKIKSCFNPLNVPVSMALEESNSLLDAIEDSS